MADNSNTITYREVNLGKLDGLSSYELAVKNGKFSGTESEYVNKEQKVYDDMVKYIDNFKKQLGLINTEAMKRLYDMGDVDTEILNNVYGAMLNTNVIEEGTNFSYTCRNDNGIIFGMESSQKFGVQIKLGWLCGVIVRFKNNTTTWSNWRQFVSSDVSNDN